MANSKAATKASRSVRSQASELKLPAQTVLVLQGGGALGAYQIGVYQALHEAGIEPDWVIGTSIGAINGALIAGNPPEDRIPRLEEFWSRMERHASLYDRWLAAGPRHWIATAETIGIGIPAFFEPNRWAWLGQGMPLGAEHASYYTTEALRETLGELVDFDFLAAARHRLTVGAVNARTGVMHYFDSRAERLRVEHVMASGALPPAFPAVRIDGEPYWDGGLYSNTPIEAVLDDKPRVDSIIFSVQLWNPHGNEPSSIADVQARIKDIQFASRAKSHIERQRQLHRLRHIVRELQAYIPASERARPEVKELAAWGCGTTMHIVKLNAPALEGEDQYKDIDFTTEGINARRIAGYSETLRALEAQPWTEPVDPIEGVRVYEVESGIVHRD